MILSCTTNDRLQVVAFKAGKGYGYRITVDGKILVKQQTIPAIAGGKVFCNSNDAILVGTEVLKKLRNQESPVIRVEDLTRLNISTNCSGN